MILLLLMVIIGQVRSQTCFKEGSEAGCDNESKLKWHQFPWQSYITKDKVTIEDTMETTKRFGLNYIHSMKIGVNRTIDDNRSVVYFLYPF